MPPPICPHCGKVVPRRAKSCPACGSDEKTGWSDAAMSDNLGLPDENFDYEAFVQEEFGHNPKPRGIHWFWWLTALLLILLLLFFWLR